MARLVIVPPRSIYLSADAVARITEIIRQQQGSEDQGSFAARMEVSAATLRRLTRGRPVTVQARMLERLSEKFGWPSDTLEQVAGGAPVPASSDLQPSDAERLKRLEAAMFRLSQDVEDLRSAVQALLGAER